MSGTKKQESINLKEILIAYIFDKISFGNNLQIQENKNKPFEINFDEA